MPKFTPENVLLQDAQTGKIPEEQGELIISDFMNDSVITKLAKYEEMSKPKKTFMYLAEGPGAYWVNEAEKIQTSKAKWLTIEMEAKKLGVILPVSKEFLNFTVRDFFEKMKPKIAEAFQIKFDQAALFGINSPYKKGISIYERAETAGNIIEQGGNLYDDFNDVMALIEENDIIPQAFVTTPKFNRHLRGAKDETGLPIFNAPTQGATATALGLPIAYGSRKAWDYKKANLFTGDFDTSFYGILQNINYEISKDATITTLTDEDGQPINLFERDLIALKATMMIGFMTIKDDAFGAIKGKEAADLDSEA